MGECMIIVVNLHLVVPELRQHKATQLWQSAYKDTLYLVNLS